MCTVSQQFLIEPVAGTRATIVPRLPLEVIGEILEYLHPYSWEDCGDRDDQGKEDLCACALVCKAWHPISRSHLFREVPFTFYPEESPHNFAKTVSTLRVFLERSPHIASSIHRLLLRQGYVFLREHMELCYDITDMNLSLLLQTIPNLQELQMWLRTARVTLPPNSIISASNLSLRHLNIEFWGEEVRPSNIHNVLRLFRSVDLLTLTLSRTTINNEDTLVAAQSSSVVRRVAFQPNGQDPPSLIKFLRSTLELNSLRGLDLMHRTPMLYQDLLDAVNPRLEHLRLICKCIISCHRLPRGSCF